MKLSFSNQYSSELVKMFPVNNNRVLLLKSILFEKGIDHIFEIMLSIYSRNKKGTVKFLRKLPLANYSNIFLQGCPGVLINEKIVLPVACTNLDFNIQYLNPFHLTLEFAVI